MILDTNALSAAADGDLEVLTRLAGAERTAVPVIVLGEYRKGIAQSRHKRVYEKWLGEWISIVPVLPIDEPTARHYADIALELKSSGKPIPTNDLWIAALCRQHNMPLLSRDRHFDQVRGLDRVRW